MLVRLSEDCRNRAEILNQHWLFLLFLRTMSIAEDKTHHMVNFPELASKINIQLMINRWVKIMMQKPESIRPY